MMERPEFEESEVSGAIWRIMRGTATEYDCAIVAWLLLRAAGE